MDGIVRPSGKKDLECMVKRDRNRACIFIWGVGNEVENQAQDSMIRILKNVKGLYIVHGRYPSGYLCHESSF